MADGIFLNKCGIETPFAGVQDCWSFDKTPKGIIVTTGDFVIPASFVANGTAGEYLAEQARVYPNTKVFPFLFGLTNVELTGGDIRTVQEGWGNNIPNGNNAYYETYTYTKGGLCLYKQVSLFDDTASRVFFVDEDNRAFGVQNVDGTVRGFNVGFGSQYRRNTGTALAGFLIGLFYTNGYKNELRKSTAFLIPEDMKGLRPLKLAVADASTESATVLLVKVLGECSNSDYTAAVSAVTTLSDFSVTNTATGTSISITAKTFDGTNIVLNLGEVSAVEVTVGLDPSTALENFLTDNYLAWNGIGASVTITPTGSDVRITPDGDIRVTPEKDIRIFDEGIQ